MVSKRAPGDAPAWHDKQKYHVGPHQMNYNIAITADRVGLETMGIPPYAVGYLQYASQLGLGQYDLAKIDVLGVKPEAVKRTYRLHDEVDQQLQWLRELPRA